MAKISRENLNPGGTLFHELLAEGRPRPFYRTDDGIVFRVGDMVIEMARDEWDFLAQAYPRKESK